MLSRGTDRSGHVTLLNIYIYCAGKCDSRAIMSPAPCGIAVAFAVRRLVGCGILYVDVAFFSHVMWLGLILKFPILDYDVIRFCTTSESRCNGLISRSYTFTSN